HAGAGTLVVIDPILDQGDDDPTILVTGGGTVQLDGVQVLESDAGNQPCIRLVNGTVDFTPGGNTLRIRGAGGSFIDNQAATAIDATGGVVWEEDSTTFSPAVL